MNKSSISTAFGKLGQKRPKPNLMINTLSQADYSFFYQASVWEKYEDLIYAISRGRYDETIKIFKADGMHANEELRPVSPSSSLIQCIDRRYRAACVCGVRAGDLV